MEICGSSAWRSVGHRHGMVVVVLGFMGLSCVKFVGLGGFGYDGWVFVGCGMGGFDVVDDGCDCCGCDGWWQWQWQWVWV